MARIEIRLGDFASVEEIEVIGVHVAVGDYVVEGQLLIEVSSDKADAEVVAPCAGSLTELAVAEGDVIPGETVLAVLDGSR